MARDHPLRVSRASSRIGDARGIRRTIVIRALVVLLLDAVALRLLDWLLDGFTLGGLGAGLVTAAAIGLLNALVWPILARIALPLTVLTLGVAAVILNAAILALA